MIEQSTVLVLGAGASDPYGFPVGVTLLERICSNLVYDPALGFKEHGRLLLQLGHQGDHIRAFRDALFRAGRTSVDAFLEHRPEFIDIGKQAIAAALIGYEIEASLWQVGRSKDWYRYLFGVMNTSLSGFGENKVSFVTFNYDRSLEQYLFTCLQNAYGASADQVREVMDRIELVHIYGQLGALPWQGPDSRPYAHSATANDVVCASRGIHIIHGARHRLTISCAYSGSCRRLLGSSSLALVTTGRTWSG